MTRLHESNLLSAAKMAEFVTNGYLMMEDLVPQELNKQAYQEQQDLAGTPGNQYWDESKLIQDIFKLPQVKGIIRSLVGERPIYDHSFLHVVQPHRLKAQNWHADSIIDTRDHAYDIQIFYFSHDAPKESGPTLVLPGSHLRRANTSSIARYKNIVGQKQLVAKAGTMVFWHQGLWHCAQPNHTDNTRYVFKLRLRSGQVQRALFDTQGYDQEHVKKLIYFGGHRWQGNEQRIDHMARAKLWRYVTGDDQVDFSFEGALSRMGITL